MRTLLIGGGAAAAAAAAIVLATAHADPAPLPRAITPIQHVVVIFGENESFDHYFATYPHATNPPGEPVFNGVAPSNRAVNGLEHDNLLTANPNGVNPERLDHSQAVTCDQNHNYGPEQAAAHSGAMDRFPDNTGGGSCGARGKNTVMDYYDGNTVTGLWNLAQHFALNDNSFGSTFGPSTPGAIELISGNTNGVAPMAGVENGTMIADPDPLGDECGNGQARLPGKNIGDEMSTAGMTWGWFQGGFRPSSTSNGKAVCATAHANLAGGAPADYSAHHEPFQYYASTLNANHAPPTSTAMIGHDDQAHHQYDLADFDAVLNTGTLPQVSFLKAASFEDAHPGNSGPLDEQRFIARAVNAIEQSPDWSSTAIILAYDDSDGWYDHVPPTILNGSTANSDALDGPGQCNGPAPLGGLLDRCGPGPRLPLLIVSPWAKQNYVDGTFTEQTSILKFIEDNWSLPRIANSFDARAGVLDNMFDFAGAGNAPKVFLDPTSGEIVATPPKTVVDPSGDPTATATATPTAVAVVTPGPGKALPTPVPVKPFKLKCSATGKGKKLTVSCSGSGDRATTLATKLKLTVTRSGKTVVKASTKLTKGKVKIVLKPKKTLRKGTYTLKVAITRSGKTTNVHLTFKVK